jgi:hypothetical protein
MRVLDESVYTAWNPTGTIVRQGKNYSLSVEKSRVDSNLSGVRESRGDGIVSCKKDVKVLM